MALFQNNAQVEADTIDDEGFSLLPDGPYTAYLYEVETGEFKSEKNLGKPRVVATFKIKEGKYKNRQMKDFAIPLFTEEGNDWANRQAKNFFITGLGLASFDEIPDDTDELLGKEIKILIGHEADNRDPEGPDRNRISRYLPVTAEVTNGAGVIKEPVAKKSSKPPAGKL